MHISGPPRQGKSVHATSITIRAIKQGEMGLMPGDLFCEWRHFLNYPKSIMRVNVLIPDRAEIDFLDIPYTIQKKFIYVDINTVNILEYLRPSTLTVVYDRCFSRTDRALLWTRILDQCRKRTEYHNIPIVFLDHEAGVNYPEIREGKFWQAVEEFSEIFVDFPKGNIRCLFVSQLENELIHKIRMKCIWKIYRRGIPSKSGPGRVVRKYAPRMRRDQYHIFFGGLYVPLNSNPKIKEKKAIWKMISRDVINLEEGGIFGSHLKPETITLDEKYGTLYLNARDSSGKFIGSKKLGVRNGPPS